MQAPAGPQLVPVAAVAKLFGVTERQVYELVRAGTIPRANRGRYDLVACTRAYIAHLREVAAGRMSHHSGAFDLVAERARLAREQADGQALKNQISRRELLPQADLESVHVAIHSAVQRRMLSLPSVVAPLVAIEHETRTCEAIIREHVEEALAELADAQLEITYPDPAEGAEPVH